MERRCGGARRVSLLGIDTATAASAVCLLRADGEAFEVEPPPQRLVERPGHAAEAMPAVASCLEDSGLDWGDLAAIAVGVGPGMFTGLRIGVATARGLAASTGLELRPVSSLAALAAGSAEAPVGVAERASTLALIDARRGEVFGALYDGGAELWEPFVAAPEVVAERLHAEAVAPLAVGDGALRYRDVLEQAGATVPSDASRAHVVRGLSVCRLAVDIAPVALDAVRPAYLRFPDATPRAA
jgi:tRNA threonylcarbamoyladenosine biosynthesis protein TsaB